jgi:hypothetical protein
MCLPWSDATPPESLLSYEDLNRCKETWGAASILSIALQQRPCYADSLEDYKAIPETHREMRTLWLRKF